MGKIYAGMPNSDFNVEAKIDSLTNSDCVSFNSNRTIIKKSLNAIMPFDNPVLLKHYEISGVKNQKKGVLLDKSLIDIKVKSLK